MVPEVGLEPTWALSPPDFESGAYTNFATPAESFDDTGWNWSGQDTDHLHLPVDKDRGYGPLVCIAEQSGREPSVRASQVIPNFR